MYHLGARGFSLKKVGLEYFYLSLAVQKPLGRECFGDVDDYSV